MYTFVDEVVIVTGGGGTGGGGSGRHICKSFAEAGAKVAVWDVDFEAARQVAEEIRQSGGAAIALKCDICEDAQVSAAVDSVLKAYKKITILVNNAFWHDDIQPQLADCTLEDWDKHLNVNLRGPFIVARRCIPELLKNKKSSIVNIGSTGALRGEDGYGAYSAAKAGLESMTRSIAAQYGRLGLRCNCVVPGLVLSQRMDALAAEVPQVGRLFHRIDRNMLLQEGHGSGQDVANAVLFFASEQARYITAQSLVVDGGTISHFPQWADQREGEK